MKNAILALLLLTSTYTLAGTDGPGNSTEPTILHVPLFVEITSGNQPNMKYKYIPLAKFNKTLVKNGQTAQMEFVDISLNSKMNSLWDVREAIDNAISAAGIKNAQAFGEYYPAAWGDKRNYTCYRGKAEDVVQIVLNSTDSVYSDQYSLFGYKIGKITKYVNAESDADFESKAWKNYDKNSDSILMVGSVGDDGTDVNESLIPHCK